MIFVFCVPYILGRPMYSQSNHLSTRPLLKSGITTQCPYGRKSADCKKPNFLVTFLVHLEILFRWLKWESVYIPLFGQTLHWGLVWRSVYYTLPNSSNAQPFLGLIFCQFLCHNMSRKKYSMLSCVQRRTMSLWIYTMARMLEIHINMLILLVPPQY